METQSDYWKAHAALDWQIELGVDEAICETPVNRYELEAQKPKPAAVTPAAVAEPAPKTDLVKLATEAAKNAQDLDALKAALNNFEHCDLKLGARNLVFSDGVRGAPVMIIGEVPDREEDKAGKPFVGPVGDLLDKMFEAISLSRTADDAKDAIYISNSLPWRVPESRDPTKEEIAMLKPFLERHIELADPKVIVLMGNWACTALLGRAGITRLRGSWQTVLGKPALPMAHPSALLRQPLAKREAWADLLAMRAKLDEGLA